MAEDGRGRRRPDGVADERLPAVERAQQSRLLRVGRVARLAFGPVPDGVPVGPALPEAVAPHLDRLAGGMRGRERSGAAPDRHPRVARRSVADELDADGRPEAVRADEQRRRDARLVCEAHADAVGAVLEPGVAVGHADRRVGKRGAERAEKLRAVRAQRWRAVPTDPEAEQRAPGGVLNDDRVDAARLRLDRPEHAEASERARGVRPEADPGSDLAERRRLLVGHGVDARLPERDCGREPRDPASDDDGRGHGRSRHGSWVR